MASNQQPERISAKKAIKSREQDDPELDKALTDAQEYQLKINQETHRHNEAMQKINLGRIGSIIGGEKSVPGVIAFVVVCFGLFATAFCYYVMWKSETPAAQEFWSKQSERGLATAGIAMSYLFGRGTRGS